MNLKGIWGCVKVNKNQEKIKTALARIDDCLATINTNEDWLKYLYFQSKFYHYSFQNAMLIYSQNPEATFVKGYKSWNQLGRYVKKGATGISILAPIYKKVEEFKEPENASVYQDKEAQKETKRILAGFLWLDRSDNPMVAMHWEKYFQHICEKYNLIYKLQIPRITPHVCRHTFCSRMASARMNPKTLQYIMGHSDISVTQIHILT